jgi:pimeloyl-ACP methyl ester carboxylesterase
MTTFVLVHGAWHGAWCWYKVVPQLRKAGHKVIAPDLPSLGRDKTALSQVNLASWAESVCTAIDSAGEPVVLVGHSLGGVVISEAAERRAEKVAKLVYLSAFLVGNGETLRQYSSTDQGSLVGRNMVMSEDHMSATIKEEALKEAFYGECSDEDTTLASMLFSPNSMVPLGTPLRLSEQGYGSVPRFYIATQRDKAISPAMQRQMYEKFPCKKVFTLDTDHSSFFSATDRLVEVLEEIGKAG